MVLQIVVTQSGSKEDKVYLGFCFIHYKTLTAIKILSRFEVLVENTFFKKIIKLNALLSVINCWTNFQLLHMHIIYLS